VGSCARAFSRCCPAPRTTLPDGPRNVAADARWSPRRPFGPSRTIAEVQGIEVALLVAASLVILGAGALRYRHAAAHNPRAYGALLGIVPGVLGAVVVLIPRTDLFPDNAEPAVWLVVGMAATGIILAAASIGLQRR